VAWATKVEPLRNKANVTYEEKGSLVRSSLISANKGAGAANGKTALRTQAGKGSEQNNLPHVIFYSHNMVLYLKVTQDTTRY
jgi:hypothetical protein